LISWESEALLTTRELDKNDFELVRPSVSILAEPPVAVVDKVARKRGTADVARAYLEYLYSDEGQEIIARSYFRPRNAEVLARHADLFPPVTTFTVDDTFGGWAAAQQKHFAEGGIFDQLAIRK
jgi:sulfate transport system substrate-binding protein